MSDFKKFCIDEKLSPVQIVGARKAWQEQQSKIDELQDRINEALEDLEYPTAPWDETIASVVKVLRGDNA